MEQTPLNYNSIMFAQNGEPFRSKEVTIPSGTGVFPAGTVLVPSGATSNFIPPADASAVDGWVVLLEDVDATSVSVVANVGISGGVFKDTLKFSGLLTEYTEQVGRKFALNNIYVVKGSNTASIAGEGV